MTTAELLNEYRGLRELWLDTGEGRYQTQLAYDRYWKQACAEGRPPDSLVPIAGPEDERFFSYLIPGPDGHNYWNGPKRFPLDSGGARMPRYWWYEHLHGKLPRGALKPVCAELSCITPTHQQFVSWADMKQRYTDQQLTGALQVVVMRLGHSPTVGEYQAESGRGPTAQIISQRFGGWHAALKSAGYGPSVNATHKLTPEICIEALRFVARIVGRAPSNNDYAAHADELRAHGLPPGTASIRHHVGPTWDAALRRAGLR